MLGMCAAEFNRECSLLSREAFSLHEVAKVLWEQCLWSSRHLADHRSIRPLLEVILFRLATCNVPVAPQVCGFKIQLSAENSHEQQRTTWQHRLCYTAKLQHLRCSVRLSFKASSCRTARKIRAATSWDSHIISKLTGVAMHSIFHNSARQSANLPLD